MNQPLHIDLHLSIQESTCPTGEFPDNSPKLSVAVVCSGQMFSTPWQPVRSVENREELVGILLDVVKAKVVTNLEFLNDNAAKHRALSTVKWITISDSSEQKL